VLGIGSLVAALDLIVRVRGLGLLLAHDVSPDSTWLSATSR
jgi:hypothetical protein